VLCNNSIDTGWYVLLFFFLVIWLIASEAFSRLDLFLAIIRFFDADRLVRCRYSLNNLSQLSSHIPSPASVTSPPTSLPG
jgi:hypothetical protein